MMRVAVEVREGRRTQITAYSVKRALEIVGAGRPGLKVRLLFPIDPGAFFVPTEPGVRETACDGTPARLSHSQRTSAPSGRSRPRAVVP